MKKIVKVSKKMFVLISKILVSLIIVVVLLVIGVTGVFLPKSYKSMFSEDYHLKFDDARYRVVSYGILAPNSHNIQSWKITLDENDENVMSLFLNEERTIPVVDSNYNQLIMSCGTFISFMEAGAEKLGYQLDITYFPNGELPNNPSVEEIKNTKIADIKLVKDTNIVDPTFDVIGGATKRLAYDNLEIPAEKLNALLNQNTFDTIEFNILSEVNEVATLKEMMIQGVDIESKNEDAMMETKDIFRYTTYDKNKNPYGLSLHSDNPSVLKRTITEFLATIMKQSWEADGDFWYQRDSKNIEETNYFGMIMTDTNTRMDQINVGLVYGNICLAAINNGLDIQPAIQVLQDYEAMNALNTQVHGTFAQDGQVIQMIFRLGETSINIPVGFRFDVTDIIEQ